MPHDVFISHAKEDKTIADAVCASLEQAGIRCWIAPRDIQPGADWGYAIIEGIKGARVFVLLLSSSANRSPHIRREVERAVNQEITVVPFRIENVLPEGALEYHLGTVHWLDAMTPPLEAHLQQLARSVTAILGVERPLPEPGAEQPQVPAIRAAVAAPAKTTPLIIGIVFAVLAVIVAGWLALQNPPSSSRNAAASQEPQAATNASSSQTAAPQSPPPQTQSSSTLDMARVQALTAASVQNPKDPSPRVQLGNMYFDVERYAAAIQWYEQALALNPADADVSVDLGIAYYYTNQPDKALAQIEHSLAVDPKHVKAWLNLGIVRAFGKQDLAGAATAWQKVVALSPDSPEGVAARKGLDGLKKRP